MAHGFLQSFDEGLDVHSAGTHPAAVVNPNAIKVMNELGIDISHHSPKQVDSYISEKWDYVITVCGNANETCPAFVGNVAHRLHIGFDDPVDTVGTEDEVMTVYRRVRNEILVEFFRFYHREIRVLTTQFKD